MWMWAIPAAILLLAAPPALMLIARLVEEARRLTVELHGLAELKPAMVELRTDTRSAQLAAARLRDRG